MSRALHLVAVVSEMVGPEAHSDVLVPEGDFDAQSLIQSRAGVVALDTFVVSPPRPSLAGAIAAVLDEPSSLSGLDQLMVEQTVVQAVREYFERLRAGRPPQREPQR